MIFKYVGTLGDDYFSYALCEGLVFISGYKGESELFHVLCLLPCEDAFKGLLKSREQSQMVVHSCNPSTWEVKVGGSVACDQPRFHG